MQRAVPCVGVLFKWYVCISQLHPVIFCVTFVGCLFSCVNRFEHISHIIQTVRGLSVLDLIRQIPLLGETMSAIKQVIVHPSHHLFYVSLTIN